MKLSMIIPCYNEEKNVELFYERVKEVFADHNFEYEYIFINDGSSDQTSSDETGDDSSDQIDYPSDDGSSDSTDGSLDNSDTWEDNGEEVQQIEY